MRILIWATIVCMLALPASAQSRAQTLADIRQELNVLYVELQRLRREMATTGAAQGVATNGTMLDRVQAIETALQELTGKTEQLEFRMNQIIRDGTNRIGDLEFRLVELEGGDVSQLGTTTTLGGDVAEPEQPSSEPIDPVSPALAAQEQADFDRATRAFDDGDFRDAADMFAKFNAAYPDGPLSVQANIRRGQSLTALGDTREGARAYLQAFSEDQDGPDAPEALFRLGVALGALGSPTEACVTLGEVGTRFSWSPYVSEARAEMQKLGCS